jgi:hypothetical protein
MFSWRNSLEEVHERKSSEEVIVSRREKALAGRNPIR